MVIVKVKELISSSPKSFDDALKEAVKLISKEKKNVTGFKIVGWNLDLKDGEIVQYKVNLKYAYLWEKKSSK